mgnify:CR=1 FL=1
MLIDYIKNYLRYRKYSRSLLAHFASYGFRAHTPFFMPFKRDDRIEMIVESPGEMKLLFLHYSNAFDPVIKESMIKEFEQKCVAYESVYDYSAYEITYIFIVSRDIPDLKSLQGNRVTIHQFKERSV